LCTGGYQRRRGCCLSSNLFFSFVREVWSVVDIFFHRHGGFEVCYSRFTKSFVTGVNFCSLLWKKYHSFIYHAYEPTFPPSAPHELGPLKLRNRPSATTSTYLVVSLVAAIDALIELQSVVQDSRFVETAKRPEEVSCLRIVSKDIDRYFVPAYQQT